MKTLNNATKDFSETSFTKCSPFHSSEDFHVLLVHNMGFAPQKCNKQQTFDFGFGLIIFGWDNFWIV